MYEFVNAALVHLQKEAVNNNVPAPINPLLIKENLQKRLQSGLESSGLGNHAEEAMSRLRDAVSPVLLVCNILTLPGRCLSFAVPMLLFCRTGIA